MEPPSPATHANSRPGLISSLAPLLEAIRLARCDEREHQRHRGLTAIELARLRASTLGALENYATVLESLAWPVPRLVLQDIRLHRALLGPIGAGAAKRDTPTVRY